MEDDQFEKLVQEAINSLPSEFAEKLDNVSIVVQEAPSYYQMAKTKSPPNSLLFGLYEGVPQTKRGNYSGVLPDKITIFKKSIEKVARNGEEIKAQVRATVIHEIGHHFGLSDKDLR